MIPIGKTSYRNWAPTLLGFRYVPCDYCRGMGSALVRRYTDDARPSKEVVCGHCGGRGIVDVPIYSEPPPRYEMLTGCSP